MDALIATIGAITFLLLCLVSVPGALVLVGVAGIGLSVWMAQTPYPPKDVVAGEGAASETLSNDGHQSPSTDAQIGTQATHGPVRRVAIANEISRHDSLYETHLDHALHLERLNRGHEPDMKYWHSNGRKALEESIRKEIPQNDPNLRYIEADGRSANPGCPRDISKW